MWFKAFHYVVCNMYIYVLNALYLMPNNGISDNWLLTTAAKSHCVIAMQLQKTLFPIPIYFFQLMFGAYVDWNLYIEMCM